MQRPLLIACLLASLSVAAPARAENVAHVNQLLSTRQCPSCDLANTGLVMANLRGADLRGADLRRANLSQADLSGADLRGANLAGASLNSANLSGANLMGADLAAADLRNAYLTNTYLWGARLDNALMQGAVGFANPNATPEHFFALGAQEASYNNYIGAIDYYNQALQLDPQFAPAYLGRGIMRHYLTDLPGAVQDAQIARRFLSSGGMKRRFAPPINSSAGLSACRILVRAATV
ncbi:MAG: hypothetical protein HC910_05640 [Spirulinaceae cyanobacterium SM2_1_0]|nr:hypothetical protein [Spirulinaceae cyanobacterium SM2_1_0]